MERIVINTSPLILFCKADLEFMLRTLFSAVVIPTGVMEEIAAYEQDGVAQQVRACKEFSQELAPVVPLVQGWDLGKGETEVISFAYHNREHIAVLDDAAAKACCRVLGLKSLGTGSILILAKQQGLIPSVREALMLLRKQGMWISDPVIRLLCAKAGETS